MAAKQGFLMYYSKGDAIGTKVSVRYRRSGRLSGVVVKRGSTVYAIDGLFGLPRKKAAGVSHRGALQGHLFFCNQEDVDKFVGKSTNSKSLPKVGTEAMTL